MRSKGFLRRAAQDWPAKVLSLAAALLLFFFYRLNRLEDRYISVPLSVILNEEFAPGSQVPKSVRIALRGESNDLFSIQEDDVRATLDLSGYRNEGVYRAPVQIEKRGSALGIDPLEIQADPSEVAIGIERRVSRVVPVTPSFRGFLSSGYELVSFRLSPSEVEVYGPASAVARVSDVSTDFIELSGRSADFAAKIRLVRKEPLVSVSDEQEVEFSAVVRPSLAARAYEALPILAVGLDPSLALSSPLPAGRMRLRSSGAALAADFAPESGALSVDFSSVQAPGAYVLPVLAVLPDGLQVDSYEPLEVAVQVVATEASR